MTGITKERMQKALAQDEAISKEDHAKVKALAGMVKMPLRKMLIAVVLGELPLLAAYIFLGAGIGEWLRV